VTTPLAATLLLRLERRLREYACGDKDAATFLRRGGPKVAARFGSPTTPTEAENMMNSHTEER
jgi:hypothetical protein